MTTPPSNKRSLNADDDSSPPPQRARRMATPTPLPTTAHQIPGPSRLPPTTAQPTPRFIPIRGGFSSQPPPPSSLLNTRRLLHPSHFTTMLDDVQHRYDAYPIRDNPNPNFLSIVDDIVTKFKNENGSNVFLSQKHVWSGDDWLKWKLSEKLMDIMVGIDDVGGLATWSFERVRAADRVARYWKGFAGMFPEEEEEEVEGGRGGGAEVEEDEEDENEEEESDDEGVLDDDTDVEHGQVERN